MTNKNRTASHFFGRGILMAVLALSAAQVCAQSTPSRVADTEKREAAEKLAADEQWLTQMHPRIQARNDAINGVMRALSSQLNGLPDPQVRANELALSLHRLSDSQLAKAADFSSLAKLDEFLGAAARTASTAKVALGDAANMVFLPIAPCRIADSRSASAGKLLANTARNYYNYGAAGQGGSVTCNGGSDTVIGAGTPSALALTVTATGAEGGGWLTLSPYGVVGSTSALNFVPGWTLPTPRW